jgi:hypothetical protein
MARQFQDSAIVGKWDERMNSVKESRTLWEAMVATCMHFAAGHQNIWWDREGIMHEKVPQDNEVFRIINLWPTALSIIQARLTTNDPRWNPRRSGLENVSNAEIDAADALLQEMWEGAMHGEMSIKRSLKLAIRHAWLQGGRLAYFRFDEGIDMPVMDTFSLWDTYYDIASSKMYEKQWLDIPVPRSVAWLKAQAKKNREMWNMRLINDLEADNLMSASRLQEQFLRKRMGRGGITNQGTALVHQTFEVQGGKIKHRLVIPNGILYEDDLPHSNLAEIFDVLSPVEDDELYPRPPCYDWIDPQKTINKVYSDIENYISTHLQGKWLLRDPKIVPPVAGQQGQKIYADVGDVTQLELQPLPQTHFMHLQQAITQFEQITGVHSESLGRMSGSADSGIAIAQLQALDEQNSADAVENYKLFMKRCGSKLLNIAAANWSSTRDIYRYDKKTGDEQHFRVIGDDFADARTESLGKDVVRIRPFSRLDTEIVVGQFFSTAEKRQELVQLLQVWQPGANPTQDAFIAPLVLDSFDIGVGRDLVRELRKMQNPHTMIAEGQSQLIMEGEGVPVNPEDNHAYYQNFYKQKAQVAMEQGDERAGRLLLAQAQRHAVMLQQNGGIPTGDAPDEETPLMPENDVIAQQQEEGTEDPLAGLLG